jgi:Mn2+/Fe2+ NRAMP family transporter
MIVAIAIGILVIQVFGSYQMIASVFKWLALALVAYVAAAVFVHPHAADVIGHTFIPTISLNKDFIAVLVAILGTTISPYLWFWQASQEVERRSVKARRRWPLGKERPNLRRNTPPGIRSRACCLHRS